MALLKRYNAASNLWEVVGVGAPVSSVSFIATGASQSSITGDGTEAAIIWPTIISSTGGGYNAATGVFTAPVTGWYHFDAYTTFTGTTSAHTAAQMLLYVNAASYPIYNGNMWAEKSGSDRTGCGAGITVYMVAGSTATVKITVWNGTKVISSSLGQFSGFLVPNMTDISSRVVDLSAATNDYFLQVGEAAKVNFTNATSVPLSVALTEGVYELDICNGDLSGTTYSGVNIFLLPNNAAVTAGTINWSRLSQYSTTIDGNEDASGQTGFILGNSPNLILSEYKIYTYLKAKVVKGMFVLKSAADQSRQFLNHQPWFDTTTAWSSLGTLSMSTACSGTAIVRRKV